MNPVVFPVRARTSGAPVFYVDSWHAPRSGARLHEGTDIFAERGSEVLAVEDGDARAIEGALTGLGVALYTPSGHYVYAHLESREGNFPRRVKAGALLGRVGTSGNAADTSPHLHFEARGVDGVPRNPVPLLSGLRLPVMPLARAPSAVSPRTVRRGEVGSGSLWLLALLYLFF